MFNIGRNVWYTLELLELSHVFTQDRVFGKADIGFDGETIRDYEEYPDGENWITPEPGSEAGEWLDVARTAPKVESQ